MLHDFGTKYYEYVDMRELYYLASGLSYREIGWKFYHGNVNKYIYAVRKLLKTFNLHNNKQLVVFAFQNNLISLDKLQKYFS